MHEHFRIVSAVVNLVIGTGILFTMQQRYRRFHLSYLKTLGNVVFLFNTLLFLMLVSKYTDLNLADTWSEYSRRLLGAGALTLAALLYGSMVWNIRTLVTQVSGIEAPRIYTLLIVIGALCGILYLPFSFFMSSPVSLMPSIVIGGGIMVLLSAEISIDITMIRRGRVKDGGDRLLNRLGWYLLSRYLFMFILFLAIGAAASWIIPADIAPYAAFLVLLYINVAPLIWLEKEFMPRATRISALVDRKNMFKDFCGEHHISKREAEIVRLILDGKSNSEIEELLFISYHTVKNHLYNVYRKLGIKNRYELVHMITRYREGE